VNGVKGSPRIRIVIPKEVREIPGLWYGPGRARKGERSIAGPVSSFFTLLFHARSGCER